jgi:hypothetical protein
MTAIDPDKLAETLAKATAGPWQSTERDYKKSGKQHDINGYSWSAFASVWVRMLGDDEDSATGLANSALMILAPTLAADWLRLNQLARDLTAKCAALDAQVAEVTAANALLMERDAEARWLLTATPHDAPLGEWAARGRAYLGKAGA